LILTASGGPFREISAGDLAAITPERALKHPTWNMGRRITIDSATLMNKGFEVIEARWLFDIPAERIGVLVHPQSVVHSMVEFVDGSIVAQLGATDMRQPIQYALTWPERTATWLPPLDWKAASKLEFFEPDTVKFPCVRLAFRALEMGGTAPAALNAADEIAVDAFLSGRIPFTAIAESIADTLDAHRTRPADSIAAVLEADREAREHARRWVETQGGGSGLGGRQRTGPVLE
jgi:1-deoxy-D-xylulose-5-phosphate reductoisomerase